MLLLLFVSTVLAAQGQTAPVPRTDTTGKALTFDFPGLLVGVAEYDEGPTGTTVFYFPKGVKAAADVRGGGPGTLNSDYVRLGYESRAMHAVVFSGGSWYGLSAATGVANAIKALRAEAGDPDFIAGVLGGIIYDVGRRRFSRVTPDDRLGSAALRSARAGWFPLGARGAGRFAMQGGHFLTDTTAEAASSWAHSGQGGAFRQVGPTRIAVFTVVNALGTVVRRDGSVVRCHRNDAGKTCPSIATLLETHLRRTIQLGDRSRGGDSASAPSSNTTLTLVVTNQKLPYWALERLAVEVHTSMARAIQPFATQDDGDILYAVTTDEVDNPGLSPIQLSVLASEVAWDAILSSVPELPAPASPVSASLPAEKLRGLTGVFQFPDGGKLTVRADAGELTAEFAGIRRIYFDVGRRYRLISVGAGRFLVDAPARDILQFESTGAATLVLNPGPWSQRAQRTQ